MCTIAITPSRRNPYNEVECSNHYARSMASYGVYLAACGYTYHGPQGRLGFAPRLTPDAFRCAFTTAEGWGTFAVADGQARLELKWGALTLRTLAVPATVAATGARVGDRPVPCRFAREGDQQVATFASPLQLQAGESLVLAVR
jgi:non-lysosomal glucosylceramidase